MMHLSIMPSCRRIRPTCRAKSSFCSCFSASVSLRPKPYCGGGARPARVGAGRRAARAGGGRAGAGRADAAWRAARREGPLARAWRGSRPGGGAPRAQAVAAPGRASRRAHSVELADVDPAADGGVGGDLVAPPDVDELVGPGRRARCFPTARPLRAKSERSVDAGLGAGPLEVLALDVLDGGREPSRHRRRPVGCGRWPPRIDAGPACASRRDLASRALRPAGKSLPEVPTSAQI